MLYFLLFISLSTLSTRDQTSWGRLINIQSFKSSRQTLMKLMISLILLPLPGAFLFLKHCCHGHRPLPCRTADKEGSPSLGLLYQPLLQETTTSPDLLSYPLFVSVKARQHQKPLINLLRLIGLFSWYRGMSSAQRGRKG